MSHGPEPCDDCGESHSHIRLHVDSCGEPIINDATEPQWLEVVFYGFDGEGRALWTEDVQ